MARRSAIRTMAKTRRTNNQVWRTGVTSYTLRRNSAMRLQIQTWDNNGGLEQNLLGFVAGIHGSTVKAPAYCGYADRSRADANHRPVQHEHGSKTIKGVQFGGRSRPPRGNS